MISRGTTPAQRSVRAPLSGIAEKARRGGVTAPAVLVIGEVAGLMETLSWFEKLPLFGRRIIVTRADHQAAELADRLRALGALPVGLSTIRIARPEDERAAEAAVATVSDNDMAVFTSPNGVESFFEGLDRLGRDARALGGVTVAAMGPGTAASLSRRGIVPDIVPDRFVAEALAGAIIAAGADGKRILLFRAEGARDVLPRLLTEAGASVSDVGAYRSVAPETSDGQFTRAFEGADLVSFTSGSSATNLREMIDLKRKGGLDLPESSIPPAASIGPVTSAAAAGAGFSVEIEASEHTIGGLVKALVSHYSEKT